MPSPPRRDRLLVVAGASGGLGLSRLALLPLLAVPVAPVVGAALVPVSVGIGLGAAGWVARSRRRAADRAHARAWLAEALAQARADLDRVLADALIIAEREITLALDPALDRRARELDAALRGVGEQVRRVADTRARDAARAARARQAAAGRRRCSGGSPWRGTGTWTSVNRDLRSRSHGSQGLTSWRPPCDRACRAAAHARDAHSERTEPGPAGRDAPREPPRARRVRGTHTGRRGTPDAADGQPRFPEPHPRRRAAA